MDKKIFAAGDSILNEHGERLYELMESASYNDKYYVVRAVELGQGRECLLKFAECEDDSYKLNNLSREGDFCFYYPFIEQVYGNFTGFAPTGEKIYGVALEFVHGTNLRDYRMALEKKLLFDEMDETEVEWTSFRQMMQFLYGMKYYTEYSSQIYLHRDIKPENVMITEAEDVVIVDFDFAHIAGSDRTMNLAGWDVAFSRGYTSPDIFSEWRITAWDITTDVYSAGRLFFFWLNGRAYFTEEQLEVQKNGQPASTVYCADKKLGYGIEANKDRFKKKYLGAAYAKLREILDKMCCNPDVSKPYEKVSDIIADMETFLLGLCDGSQKVLEERLQFGQWRLLQERKYSDDRRFALVAYKVPGEPKVGQPLYENSIRDICYQGKLMFSVCNFHNQITYIPAIGREIEACNGREDYSVKDGDRIVCDGVPFEFTVVRNEGRIGA